MCSVEGWEKEGGRVVSFPEVSLMGISRHEMDGSSVIFFPFMQPYYLDERE